MSELIWGKHKENIVRFNAPDKNIRRVLINRHRLYVRFSRFELRLMNPFINWLIKQAEQVK